jgi:hypothetical protein
MPLAQNESAEGKLGVIILGASLFPNFPPERRLDNLSFARSAQAFRDVIATPEISLLGAPAMLDLFDSPDDPAQLIRRIRGFLKDAADLTDVIIYYCGHGDFLPDAQKTYILTLNATEPDNEAFTALPPRQMRLALDAQLAMKRVFLIFDCCFASRAAAEWQSATGIGHVIEAQVFEVFPKRGTSLIAASAKGAPALAPAASPLTMFTGAMVETIAQGLPGQQRELSFRDVFLATKTRIVDTYGPEAVVPVIHAPYEPDGDISLKPFFRNKAYAPPPDPDPHEAELEIFALVSRDLESALTRTRLAALDTLSDLFLETRSPDFASRVRRKIESAASSDDSHTVRHRSDEIIAFIETVEVERHPITIVEPQHPPAPKEIGSIEPELIHYIETELSPRRPVLDKQALLGRHVRAKPLSWGKTFDSAPQDFDEPEHISDFWTQIVILLFRESLFLSASFISISGFISLLPHSVPPFALWNGSIPQVALTLAIAFTLIDATLQVKFLSSSTRKRWLYSFALYILALLVSWLLTATPSGMSSGPIPSTHVVGVAPPLPSTRSSAPPVGFEAFYHQTSSKGVLMPITGNVSWLRILREGRWTAKAAIELPARNATITIIFDRNYDTALAASHIVEIRVSGQIERSALSWIQDITVKRMAQARGETLTGAVTSLVGDGVFRIVLPDRPEAVAHNLRLLKDSAWFDLDLRFKDGTRGVLTFGKGTTGDGILERAMTEWLSPAQMDWTRTQLAPAEAALPGASVSAAPDHVDEGVMELPPEGYFMQVGSHRSLEAASDAYSDLQDRFASALGGLDPDIKEEDLGAKGVYYRVRVGPWQTREEAAQICETLKVAGGSCLVTR